jgi:hypothetical protein
MAIMIIAISQQLGCCGDDPLTACGKVAVQVCEPSRFALKARTGSKMRRLMTVSFYLVVGLAAAWTIVRFWPQHFKM